MYLHADTFGTDDTLT